MDISDLWVFKGAPCKSRFVFRHYNNIKSHALFSENREKSHKSKSYWLNDQVILPFLRVLRLMTKIAISVALIILLLYQLIRSHLTRLVFFNLGLMLTNTPYSR